jgi:hypothetical protein
MAVDIATIGLAVDTKDVKNASRDLDNLTKSGDKAAGSADGMAKSYKAAGVAIGLAAAGAVAGLVNLVKKSIDLADANSKAAQQVGVHIEKLTALQHAANLAGVNSQQLNDGLLRFSKAISEAQQGTKAAVSIFADLGIQLKDNEGNLKTTDKLLLDVADRFAEYADGATKTAAAQELFGRSGAQLIPMLNQGAKGIEELMKQAKALGLVMDQETATAAENFNDSITVMQSSFGGIINRVTQQLTPTLIELTGIFLDIAQDSTTAATAAQVLGNVMKGLVSIGIAVASAFNTVGTALGGLIAANMALLRGDFKGAWNILKETATDAADSVEKAVNRITKLWTGDYKDAGNTAIAVSNALKESKEQLVRTTEDEAGATAKAAKAQEDYNVKLQEQIQDLAIVNYWLEQGIELEEARLRVQLARNGATAENLEMMVKEVARQKEILDIEEKRKKLIEDTKKANQKASDDYLKSVKDAEKKRQKMHEDTAKELQRSITDAMMRGFENGLGFAQNFKDTLINMFKTLVLRPIIQAVVSPVANSISSAFSGIFGGQGGGITSIFGGSGGNSLIGTIRDGFSALNSDVVGAVGDLGTFLSTGNGGLGDKIGGFLGQYQSQIATALSFAPAVFSLLSGDIKGAAFQGAGAALGTVLGGPVGGAIGSFLGGAVGGLFGGSGEKYKQVFQTGTSTFDGSAFSQKLGIDVRAGKQMQKTLSGIQEAFSRNLYTILDEFDMGSKISTSIYARLRRTSGRTASQFKYNVGGARGGASSGIGPGLLRIEEFETDGDIGKGIKKLSEVVLGKVLVQAIQRSQLPEGIRALFAGFKKSSAVNEMIGAVINLNRAADGLNERFGLTVDEAAKVSKQLGFTGQELTKFVNEFATLANGFNTVGAALIRARDDLTEAYGTALPASLKEFDAALKAIDTTTKAGIKTFAELFSLRGSFEQYQAAIDGLKGNVRGAIYSMVSDQEKLAMQREDMAKIFTELGYAIPGSIQELVALGKSIDFTTEEGLNLAAVFPTLVQAFQSAQSATDALVNSLNQLDQNKFRSTFEFTRAQLYQKSGIPLSMLPSYDVGTPYVPKTGPAIIHQGERILTRRENADFTGMVGELRNMRSELQSIAVTNAKLQKSVDRLEKYGFIVRDVNAEGQPQILQVEVVS